MEKSTFEQIFKRYKTSTCTPEEKALVESWYNSLHKEDSEAYVDEDLLKIKKDIWREITGNTGVQGTKRLKITRYNFTVAATVLVFVLTGAWFLTIKYKKNDPINDQDRRTVKYTIVPGGNKAVLTLANGRKIDLSEAGYGQIAKQGSTNITKTTEGKLVYVADQSTDKNAVAEVGLNTIETPRGGQYRVDLPDGTKVWLNAASVLKYPTQFTGAERKVELSGEAYFEVAHNKAKPFIVNSHNQEVKVLGTHFNINAYDDEPSVNTTLLEGSVLVMQVNTRQTKLLKPGERAQVTDYVKVVNDNDVQEAVAWKNGMIKFTNQDIKSIMRMIARWYNVNIIYQGNVSNIPFGGSVSRSMDISGILKVLETTGYVHFKMEGRSVIVMP